jgi:peroxiredoxin
MNDNFTIDKINPVNWIVILFVLLGTFSGKAQSSPGFDITVKIKNAPDSVLYLANYYGDKTYLTDTAFRDRRGEFVFQADTLLPVGVYIIAGQHNNKYFELIVNKEQNFEVNTTVADIFSQMKFKDSHENEVFYNFINYNGSVQKRIQLFSDSLAKLEGESDASQLLSDSINKLRNAVKEHKQLVVDENPELFVSVLLNGMNDPVISDYDLNDEQIRDSVFLYQFYKNHYWDNFDPADPRLLRTPVYHRKLETYFNKIVYQQPDSINKEIDKFVSLLEENPETFKYVVWYLTYKFETSNVMGFDEIFVHMIDTYYTTGKAFWTGKSTLKALQERADALRKILIGVEAPNMILLDTANGFKSLYSQKAEYLIILFYETDCGHCRREIKALKTWDLVDSLDFKVFAVCTDTSLVQWKKFIKEQELPWIHVNGTRSVTPDYHQLYDIRVTPTIFLLDNRKKIIAKRLKIDQLKPFLEHYSHNQKRSD